MSIAFHATNVTTGYGKKKVLNGITLTVAYGEMVALIGHNGAGKSTLLKAIFGLLPLWSGQIAFDGISLSAPNPRKLLQLGVAYVPQGNRVFPDLTVYENLLVGSTMLPDRKFFNDRIEHVFELFPAIKARFHQLAATLSGGEKQMLALANALILSPRLLLLDEPSLGLAPNLTTSTFSQIRDIVSNSRVACLIVEQKVREILKIADRAYVLRNGQFSFEGSTRELNNDEKLREVYL